MNEFLYICEVNDQNHGFSFDKTDLVLVSMEARFEFWSTEFSFGLWLTETQISGDENNQNHDFSFAKSDFVLVSKGTRFEFRSAKTIIENQIQLTETQIWLP